MMLVKLAPWAFIAATLFGSVAAAQQPPALLPPENAPSFVPGPTPEILPPPEVLPPPESVVPQPPPEIVPSPSSPEVIPPTAPQEAARSSTTDEVGLLITSIVNQHIPHDFKDESDWGHQAERWDGVIFKREGLRVTTERRTKEVNHGSWTKYEGKLIEPEKSFDVRILNLRDLGTGKVAFDIEFTSRVAVLAKYAKWVKGVQLIALSADTRSLVTLTLGCEVAGRLDLSKLPPDMIVDPYVTSAKLELQEFEVERVSKLDGPVVKEIGRKAHGLLQDKIDDYQPKIVEKINKEIDKNRDRFRISFSDFLKSKWGAYAEYLDAPLPETE